MCWAACLSWWLKAVYKENHDQWDIDQDYASFWDDGSDNLLSKAGIVDIVNGPWRMYWEEYASGPQFSIEELRRHLVEGPAYVGYYDPNVGSHHVNCIYAIKDASGSNPQIMVMEPAFKRNPAASGCAAAAGIPLTHRGLATGVRFLTGHCRAGADLGLNWQSLADPETTLVVYMGLANLPEISARLIEAGMPEAMPAAAIENGTTGMQRVCETTLAHLPDAVVAAGLKAPVLVIIGRVVEAMAWIRAGGEPVPATGRVGHG
jgi:hypothetical protein